MTNSLIEQVISNNGLITYKIATFDIDVVARLTGGIAPTISYFHKDKEVTDTIRKLRFQFENPASTIENYEAFQSMLYKKEQHALNELYESFSIKPKNMSTPMQILWHFFVFLLITLPLLLTALLVK